MSEKEILAVENGLLMAFSEVYDIRLAWYPEFEILCTAGCQDISAKVVEEARRRLGIESIEIHGLNYWRWISEERAEDIWERIEYQGGYKSEGTGH